MPTALPFRPAPVRRLSWPKTIRFLGLVARLRWLNVHLHAAHRRSIRLGTDAASDRLLQLAHRWLVTHEAMAALLGIPEPSQVAQVRRAIRPSTTSPGPGR